MKHAPARGLAAALLLVLAACGGNPAMRAQGGRLSNVPDADESRYSGKEPVVVLSGQATYYSDSLAGNRTANGEIYDPGRLTAASRDLPFGSVVRVIRRDTGAYVLVRINDRGPFGNRRRILDLSRAAAARIDILKRGVVDVRAEVLELGPEKKRKRKAKK
jgi:rare lipoprotein A